VIVSVLSHKGGRSIGNDWLK